MAASADHLAQALLHIGDRPIRHVLVPTDLSERSLKALGLAVEIAASAGADLHLLHVHQAGITPADAGGFPTDEQVRSSTWSASPDSLRVRAKEHLDELVVHRSEVESHDISKAIEEYAAARAIDLIVITTAARHGISRFFMGSIAEQLVVGSPCPVLTLAEDAPIHFAPPRPKLLVPVDFSDASLDSLALASNLCEQLDGEMLLLHVISDRPLPAAYGDFAMAAWSPDDVTPQVQSELEQLAERIPDSVACRCLVRSGLAASEIVQVARDENVDLIQIASHGLSGFAKHVLGSVAQRVLRLAPVPVLVLKPFGERISLAPEQPD